MKTWIIIILLFTVLTSISQTKLKILVVPLNVSKVKFDGTVNRMLKYNSVVSNRAADNLDSISVKFLESILNEFSIKVMSEVDILKYHIADYQMVKKDGVIEREFENKENIKQLQISTDFKYIIFFNKLETVTKKPFSRKTTTRNYLEIYDSKLQQRFVCFSEFNLKISKKMYYSSYLYEFRNSMQQLFTTIKKGL